MTYLVLQLVKTITWLVLFALVAVDKMKVQKEMKVEEWQGQSFGISSDFSFLKGFVETLILL